MEKGEREGQDATPQHAAAHHTSAARSQRQIVLLYLSNVLMSFQPLDESLKIGRSLPAVNAASTVRVGAKVEPPVARAFLEAGMLSGKCRL